MDDNRTTTGGQNAGPNGPRVVGGLAGEAKKHIGGAVDDGAGKIDSGKQPKEDDKQGETMAEGVATMSATVKGVLRDNVEPALAQAAETAQGYAREAGAVVAAQAQRAATTVKDHPLVVVLAIAAIGFILGRVTAPTVYATPYQSVVRRFR